MVIRIIDKTKEKFCSKCRELKPLTEFYANSSMKDGHCSRCKVCTRDDSRSYYREHTDERKAYAHEYRRTEAGCAADRRYKQSERGKAVSAASTERYLQTEKCKVVSAARRKRYEQSEKGKAMLKRYKSSEKGRAAGRLYSQTEKGKSAARRYNQSKKGKVQRVASSARHRARLEEAEGDVSSLEIFKLLHDAEMCTYCRRTDVELTIEHVVPLSRGGSHALDNLLPVCKSCNSSKGAKLLEEWLNAPRSLRERI